MRMSQAFPSKWISAADLNGKDVTVTIDRVTMEEIDQGNQKPVIYFRGAQKGLVLNKTNATNISDMYGDEANQWGGQKITLFSTWVDFQGRSVEAIRVRPGQAPQQTQGQQSGIDQSQAPPQQGQGGNGQNESSNNDLSDSIPF